MNAVDLGLAFDRVPVMTNTALWAVQITGIILVVGGLPGLLQALAQRVSLAPADKEHLRASEGFGLIVTALLLLIWSRNWPYAGARPFLFWVGVVCMGLGLVGYAIGFSRLRERTCNPELIFWDSIGLACGVGMLYVFYNHWVGNFFEGSYGFCVDALIEALGVWVVASNLAAFAFNRTRHQLMDGEAKVRIDPKFGTSGFDE